jgi:hypothetical protein
MRRHGSRTRFESEPKATRIADYAEMNRAASPGGTVENILFPGVPLSTRLKSRPGGAGCRSVWPQSDIGAIVEDYCTLAARKCGRAPSRLLRASHAIL